MEHGRLKSLHCRPIPVIETLVSLTRDSFAPFPPYRAGVLNSPGRDARAAPAVLIGDADCAEHRVVAGRGFA